MGNTDIILKMLRSRTGHDFSSYKEKSVQRRIERHMAIRQIDRMDAYVRFLRENPQELNSLLKELLIGVTSFFRDPMEWELLKDKVIPELLADRAPNDTIRVWVSGCSTGEEAYSLAIAFQEVMGRMRPAKEFSLQIFATDLDMEAIHKAREGIFSTNIEEEMSLECLNRYFVKVANGYQVVKPIRDMVMFAQQNMIMDPPFTKIDLLTCRNMLIYLTPEMQKKLIPLFHCSLNPGGFLFLGSAETIVNFTELFKPFDRRSRLYRRLQTQIPVEPVGLPCSFTPSQSAANQTTDIIQNIQTLTDKLILQYYSPATVLVNSKGDILYMTGPTDQYLELAAGNIEWNILSVAHEGLNHKLKDALDKALRQKKVIMLNNIIVINRGQSHIVDISINPLKGPKALRGTILVAFIEVVISDALGTINTTGLEAELQRELVLTRQLWQAASTEMQISQEELKSNNEELQATNEELQSVNEELTTTKEEALLSNEELKLVNCELQAKVDGLSLAAVNVKNQMDGMNIAALFLDHLLRVKHFTKQMSVIYRLIPSDVGRPITDIASDLVYPELEEDINEVLRTQVVVEKLVLSHDGCQFKARILPYRTVADVIDGVVITFIDITL